MSIENNYELFVCNCHNISHQFVISSWDDGDKIPTLDIYVKLNSFQPWYKRLLIAIKFLLKIDVKWEYDCVMLDHEKVNKLQNAIADYKVIECKYFSEDVEFDE